MKDSEDQMRRASKEAQARMLVEVAKSLYAEGEAVLLEEFRHVEPRPRDGFDALVLIAALARKKFQATLGIPTSGQSSEESDERLVFIIMLIGSAIENEQITVSPTFTFTGKEIVEATKHRLDAGEVAFSKSVAAALKRLQPVMTALFERLVNGETSPVN